MGKIRLEKKIEKEKTEKRLKELLYNHTNGSLV